VAIFHKACRRSPHFPIRAAAGYRPIHALFPAFLPGTRVFPGFVLQKVHSARGLLRAVPGGAAKAGRPAAPPKSRKKRYILSALSFHL